MNLKLRWQQATLQPQRREKASTSTTAQRSLSKQKSANWDKEETKLLLQAWGPKYEQFKKVSARGQDGSIKTGRTLPQLKKRIQILMHSKDR